MDMHTPLYVKWITKVLLLSTGTSAQCYVAARWEGSLGRMYTYVCMASSFSVHLKLSLLFIGYTPI